MSLVAFRTFLAGHVSTLLAAIGSHRNVWFACLSTILISLPAFNLKAQPDSLVLIPDKVILRVKPAFVSHFSRLVKRNQSLSPSEQSIADILTEKGISGYRFLHRDTSTRFKEYVVLAVPPNRDVVSVYQQLKGMQFVDRIYLDFKPRRERLNGGFAYHDSSYANEGVHLNWDYINTPDAFEDSDMSILEAWEFTKGDSTVKVAVSGGYVYAAPFGDSGPQQAELSGNILAGTNYLYRLFHEIMVLNLSPDSSLYDENNTWLPWNSSNPGNDASVVHGTTCAKIICAKHDTTSDTSGNAFNGCVGFAPEVKVIPVIGYYGSMYAEAILDAASRGATAFSHSMPIPLDSAFLRYQSWDSTWNITYNYPNHDIVRDAAEAAYSQTGMLFVNAFGNESGYPQPISSSPHGLAVATFSGGEKGEISLSGSDVTICGNGGYGGGTSFAAPTVAAVAALIKSFRPEMNGNAIREKLLHSTNPLHDSLWNPDTSISQLGCGALDAYQAISTRLDTDISTNTTLFGPVYVAKDVVVHQNDTLRIVLSELSNGLRRTHVRFATRDFNHPDSVQQTRLIVEGTLIVEGEPGEKILFSNLRNDEQIAEWKWRGSWGGIAIRNGGHAVLRNAIVENCRLAFDVSSGSTLTMENCEIHHVDKGALLLNSATATLDNCSAFDGGYGVFVTGTNSSFTGTRMTIDSMKKSGVEVFVETPASVTIDSSRIHHCEWGIVINGPCDAYVRHDTVEHNRRDGITYLRTFARTNHCVVSENGQNGVYCFDLGTVPEDFDFTDNLILGNGTTGNWDATGYAGLLLYNTYLYATENNLFAKNPIGIRVNVGCASARSVQNSWNRFDSNYVSVALDDRGHTELGIQTLQFAIGKSNSSTLRSVESGMRHATAANSSGGFLQCNRWTPPQIQYFQSDDGSWLCTTPDSADCSLGSSALYTKAWMLSAFDATKNADYLTAKDLYDSVAFDPQTNEIDLRLSIVGLDQLYFLDPDRVNGDVEQSLDSISIARSGAPDDTKAFIACAQSVVSVDQQAYAEADSLIRYACQWLQSGVQRRNMLTLLSYMHLYCLGKQGTADSINTVIGQDYPDDPFNSVSINNYDLYRGDCVPPIPKVIAPNRPVAVPNRAIVDGWPNPAGQFVRMRFTLPDARNMRAEVYDILGRTVVGDLRLDNTSDGEYITAIDTSHLRPGSYFFCVFHTGGRIIRKFLIQ